MTNRRAPPICNTVIQETTHKVTLGFQLHLGREARCSLTAIGKAEQPSSIEWQRRGIVRIRWQMAQYDGDGGLQQERGAQPYRTEELSLPIPGMAARAGQDIMAIWPQQMHPYALVLVPVEAPIGMQADGLAWAAAGFTSRRGSP